MKKTILPFFLSIFVLMTTSAPAHSQDDSDVYLQYLIEEAELDDTASQYQLGIIYYAGRGVDVNYDEARWWFQSAAEQGHQKAQYALGYMYFEGEGVSKNSAEAVRWFKLSAEKGFAPAQASLGNRYFNGDGVGKDNAEARHAGP